MCSFTILLILTCGLRYSWKRGHWFWNRGCKYLCRLLLVVEENLMKSLFAFCWQRNGFQKLSWSTLHTLITEFFWFAELQFKIARKIHIKASVDESRSSGVRVFLWGTWRRSWQETMVSSKTVPQDLNVKFRSTFNRAFTNHGYFHRAVLKALHNFKQKRVHKEIDR